MRRIALLALAAAALAGAPAFAQAPGAGGPPAPGAPDFVTAPHRAYAGGVTAYSDVRYAVVRGFRPLTLDLYRPDAPGPPRPAVLWLHGGGWAGGDSHTGAVPFPDWGVSLASLSARGYVVVSLNYRLSGEARFPAQIEDVKQAVRWLRANAAALGVDPGRIAAWGGSAGGQLAALLGVSCGVAALEGPAAPGAPSSCVQAVVDWYGPTDLLAMDAQSLPTAVADHNQPTSPESVYLGCALPACPPERVRQASAVSFVDKSDPPFLIFHGDADVSVAPGQSQELDAALRKAGVPSRLVMVPGSAHTFAGVSREKGQEILQQVFAFLDQTLGVKR